MSVNAISKLVYAGAALSLAILVATPLPAALPLFVTGLGMFGALGWRRKRKSTDAATA